MRLGLHLPQYGRAATLGAIQRVALAADALGYDDVWVSDHLEVPVEQSYPPPYLYDPLQSLAFAGAVTHRIGLGTSVLVMPQYTSPLALANTLASLDSLSGGRLVVGAGIGWSAREYEALGASFERRGERLEEIVSLLRTVWNDDPASHAGGHYPFRDIRLLPKPAHPIEVWLGGGSEAAIERAGRIADGYHGIGLSAPEVTAIASRLRSTRGGDFTVSLRVTLTEQQTAEEVRQLVGDYSVAGVDHLLLVPERGDLDAWLRCAESWAGAR